ncbi:YfiT family bacillithiol transferase [Flavobacterium sp.]|uniref:YfiT family bacillithiol transferase n=1 Tax=Flavobacterium sp. TaxID=239 RepID=UPI00261A1FA2|nr:putative metal-dependent hydrolase [Flavobacterium sp.]
MKNEIDLEKLKFPIGHFDSHMEISNKDLTDWKETIATLPHKLQKMVHELSSEELNWKYRPNGWTIKQVVHHLADSHLNSFIRFKLTLTEDTPTIRPYDEAKWAETVDGLSEDLTPSLQILEGVHQRWSLLLDDLTEADWNRMYFHPEHQHLVAIKTALGTYNWHCQHHLAHIEQALYHRGEFN